MCMVTVAKSTTHSIFGPALILFLPHTMKRSQPDHHPSSSPSIKKIKVSSQDSVHHSPDEDSGQWTKVERRKAKKSKKAATNIVVRVPGSLIMSSFPYPFGRKIPLGSCMSMARS
jgi:hypothetical protein